MRKMPKRRMIFLFLATLLLNKVYTLNPKMNWWFNTNLNQIKQKCDDKGTDFFTNLVNSVQRFKDICKVKYAKIEKEFWKSYSNITLKYMLHEHCYNDYDVRNAVLNMTNNVQLCLKKDERIKKNNKKMIMRRIFDAACSMMEVFIGPLDIFFNAKTECEEILRKDGSFNNCYEKYPNVWPAHSLWPLPFVHPNQVCNEKRDLLKCQWETVKDCISFTWYTHATFDSLLNKAWSSIFCKNMISKNHSKYR